MDKEQIMARMERFLEEARDAKTGKVSPMTLVELTAIDLGHVEWTDDYDHPIFDLAVDMAEAAELQD